MDAKLVDEVIACLQGERTLFYYYPDRYAAYLLQKSMSENIDQISINSLRRSKWASLLARPLIQDVISRCGNGKLTKDELIWAGLDKAEPFVLTLGKWGEKNEYRWAQTSRPGSNLVLQLNLSEMWNQAFVRMTNVGANRYFYGCHPLSESRSFTLAWARLDVDFENNEVLIEEIQSDLVRDFRHMLVLARKAEQSGEANFSHWYQSFDCNQFISFAEKILGLCNKTWHEAMLTAAISFCFDELGIENIYYHSFETGNVLKGLRYCLPPQSLYTTLPKKFCFSSVDEGPKFILKTKEVRRKLKKYKNARWFYMAA